VSQLNVGKVPEATKRKLDEFLNRINAAILNAGHKSITRKEVFLVGIYKYLVANMGFTETMDYVKRKKLVEKFVEEFEGILKEAYNV